MAETLWPPHVAEIVGGDLAVAVCYRTPAGGVVLTPVSPLGQHDPKTATVGFSTSIAMGRKLHRLKADNRVALLYPAREHGFADSPHLVLVQGRASFHTNPDPHWIDSVEDEWNRFLVPRKRGRFWDWLGHEYYALRVPITVDVNRLVTWNRQNGSDEVVVVGDDLPRRDPPSQTPPPKGKDPHIPVRRFRRRLVRSRHTLLGYVGADGFPVLRPVDLTPDGEYLKVAGPGLPEGARCAGVLAHWFEPRLKGQGQAVLTGWLEVGDGQGSYATHTFNGYTMPRVGDVGFTLAVGLGTKTRYRQGVRRGQVRDGR